MQQGKNLLNLHELRHLDKNKKVLQNQEDCLEGLKDAIDVTMNLTKSYLDEHIFDYCVITSTINDLKNYIGEASQREADILIKKMNNLFEATPRNKSILGQMPLKKLLDTAKQRLVSDDAYKKNNEKTTNYDFMVNMLALERAFAKCDHPFIILSLNAENLFTALLTIWKLKSDYADETAQEITELLNQHKMASPFFELIYKDSAFICLEALCFDIHAKCIQKDLGSIMFTKTVRC